MKTMKVRLLYVLSDTIVPLQGCTVLHAIMSI